MQQVKYSSAILAQKARERNEKDLKEKINLTKVLLEGIDLAE